MSGGATGVVYRIAYGATAPTITSQPASRTVAPGTSVTFSVRASGPAPLRYQWQRNGANIAGATAQDYTIASVAQADNGARFRAVVTNDFGSTTSAEAVLTVSTNQAPTATITAPAAGTLYSGGMVDQLCGNRLGSGGRHAAGERLHVACRLPSRHPHSPVHGRDDRRAEWDVHDPDHGRDVRERLVSHLPDRPRRVPERPTPSSATSCRARCRSRSRRTRPGCSSASTVNRPPRRSPSTRSWASSGASTRRRPSRRVVRPTSSSRGPMVARQRTR